MRAVLVTHDHEDHAEGAAAFAARVRRAAARRARLDGAERVKDGATFPVDGAVLRALHAPGHSADHLVLSEPDSGALFTGDAVSAAARAFIDPPDGDLATYLASLQRMLDLTPRTIYPGHGPLRHRRRRRSSASTWRIARSARSRCSRDSPMAPPPSTYLVAEIYASYPEEVWPLAARSVTAHLLKLEGEGRVAKKGRGASQTWSVEAPRECARCGRPVRGRARTATPCMLLMLQEGGAATADADA